MKSVRTKIVGLIVASLILVLGIYSTLLYINLKQIVVANQEEHLSKLAVAACRYIADWLDGRKREMAAVSDSHFISWRQTIIHKDSLEDLRQEQS